MNEERSVEEEYGFRERKERRSEAREASRRDRSQYKKSDQKKKRGGDSLHPNIKKERESFLRGRVVSIVSQEVTVDVEGVRHTCVIRGLLKRDRSRKKNIVAVGDWVLFELTGDNEGLIAHVEERKSVLSRADNLSRRQEQIISANVDQVFITMSVVNPPLKPFLIDRYIIAAEKGNMTPIVVFNKLDLLKEDPDEEAFFHDVVEAYRSVGITTVGVSAMEGMELDALRELMRDKVSVFSGQSGVGKSSLINATTGAELEVGEVVRHTKKGAHTTTSAKLLPLPQGGWCVDTPGIKSFGVWDLEVAEVQAYFPEIMSKGEECKFSPCSHMHEPQCAVQEAVEEEEIHPIRYASYCQLMETIGQEHKRR